jgi:hypothetical protein
LPIQTSPDKREAFVQKKGKAQLDEEALIEIERHRSIQDSRKFYMRLNDVRRPFEPQVAVCRALRQILEKCNEFNITTHHLFIDFKAAYDAIIRCSTFLQN